MFAEGSKEFALKKPDSISIQKSRCVVIAAHPDDETLWAGGMMLMNPDNAWTILSLCRKSDPDRNPKFFRAVKIYQAAGIMGDLDDGPDQAPMESEQIQETILSLLPIREYDFVFTHSTEGEYTRHRRHEETAAAVLKLLQSGRIQAKQLWMFAYEDANRSYTPKAIAAADRIIPLPPSVWEKKRKIITGIYGFSPESWEAKTTPQTEAFWCFRSAQGVRNSIRERSMKL